MMAINLKINPRKAMTILGSAIAFSLLYAKAVNRLDIRVENVLIVYSIAMMLLNHKRGTTSNKSNLVKAFLYVSGFSIIMRYFLNIATVEDSLRDMLVLFSCLILIRLNSETMMRILQGACWGTFVILYYWAKFQIENGGLSHIVFIGNRWCLVFFAGGIISSIILLKRECIGWKFWVNGAFWGLLVLLTYSRTALLVYIVFLALVAYLQMKNNLTKKKVALYFIGVLAILACVVIFEDKILTLLNGKWDNANMDSSMLYRVKMWSFLMGQFTFWGISSSDSAFSLLYKNFSVSNFHNVYVQSYVYGFFVSLTYIIMNIAVLVQGVREYKRNKRCDALVLAALAFMILGVAESYFLFDYTYTYMAILFLLLCNEYLRDGWNA